MHSWWIGMDVLAGWLVWSLAHNLGHRWWHAEMRQGKQTFYAHGEREHHRVYDEHRDRERQKEDDPSELFISFPFIIVAPFGLVFVAIFGWFGGWNHCVPFATGLYISMVLDHRLHILFHKKERLGGWFGSFQRMHLIHHTTHTSNYFFVSGLIWDILFRTAQRPARIESGYFRSR
jgi:hypothetical protein